MAKQPEHAGKGAREDDKADESAAPSKADLMRIQLKRAIHFVTIGFSPIVSALALAIAVVAVVGNQSTQDRLAKATEKLEGMNTAQPASKAELEKIRTALSQEQSLREEQTKKREEESRKQDEERKKQEAITALIVQNVSKLQAKAKITPTLADQLRLAASAPAAAPTLATAPPAPAKAADPVPPPKPVEKKFSPQVQSMKEAIEQYNK